MTRVAILAMAIVLSAGGGALAQTGWREAIQSADQQRLDNQAQARSQAMSTLQQATGPDARIAARAMKGAPVQVSQNQLLGNWRCRVIKTGGDLPVTVYGFFDCQIEQTAVGLVIQKTSGSQRFFGRLYPDTAQTLVYLGALSLPVDGQPPGAYGENADYDQVGRLYQISRSELRLELPNPRFESDYDVVQFLRSKSARPRTP